MKTILATFRHGNGSISFIARLCVSGDLAVVARRSAEGEEELNRLSSTVVRNEGLDGNRNGASIGYRFGIPGADAAALEKKAKADGWTVKL